MKKKLIIYLTIAILILSQAITARAEDGAIQHVKFHPTSITPVMTIPDAEDTISWTNTETNPDCSGSGDCYVMTNQTVSLQNLCGAAYDVTCPTDIYYRVSITATYHDAWSNTAPLLQVSWGSNSGDYTEQIACQPTGTDGYGTCEYNESGMLAKDDLITLNGNCETLDCNNETMAWRFEANTSPTVMLTTTSTVTVSTSPIPDESCMDPFTVGNVITTFTLAGNSASGKTLNTYQGWPTPGEWVLVHVASGYWQNNGAQPDRRDVALSVGSNGFTPLQDNANVKCHEAENYYLQVQSRDSYTLRVNDTDGNFNDNTGSLTISLFALTYAPPQSGCDAAYKLGSQIEHNTVQATDPNGTAMGTGTGIETLPVGGQEADDRYFALELTDGPHWDGGNYLYDSEINTGSTWYKDVNLPSVSCVVPLDTMGRVRIYFPYTKAIKTWKFRAYDEDGNFSNNQGHAGYVLYYATKIQVYDPGDPTMDCSRYYSHAATGTSYTVQANTSSYKKLTVTAGNIYAIETTGGPWWEGTTSQYLSTMDFSDNGTTWEPLYAYPYALCAQATDDYHVLVYWKAMPGIVYRIRVDDPNDSFSDNTGSMGATLYTATNLQDPWTPCSAAYILSKMPVPDKDRKVPADLSNGIAIPYIQSDGKTNYAIEITNEATWSGPGHSNEYATEISNDGGSTWQGLSQATWVTCVVQIEDNSDPLKQRFRIVFVANGSYRIRTSTSGDLNWPLRTGSVYYILSKIQDSIPPGPPTPYYDPNWPEGCSGICSAPGGFFKIAPVSFGSLGSVDLPLPAFDDWMQYGSCQIQQFLTWCPSHSEALAGIVQMFDKYEPFGTVIEVTGSLSHLNDKLSSQFAAGGEGESYAPYSVIFSSGGGEGASEWNGVLPAVSNSSPWAGGDLTYKPLNVFGSGIEGYGGGGEGGSTTALGYVNYCKTIFEANLGLGAATGLCVAVSMAKTAPVIWIAIQLGVDAFAILGIFQYITRKWIDLGASK
jgi:hypothetical protein